MKISWRLALTMIGQELSLTCVLNLTPRWYYLTIIFPPFSNVYIYIYSIIFLHNCFLQIFRILLGINVRVLFILLLLGFGAIFYMGASTSPIIVFVITICILSFLVAIYLMKWVLAKDEGPPEMVQVNIL